MFHTPFHVIQSDALGEKVVLVNGNGNLKDATDLYPECVAYTHAEVDKLYGIPRETLQAVHEIKKYLKGCVSLVSEPEQ
ncbi:MAG: hypothetical protein ACYTFG_20115 [Planctomycetota bacterium]|jgi:hypothetical protein